MVGKDLGFYLRSLLSAEDEEKRNLVFYNMVVDVFSKNSPPLPFFSSTTVGYYVGRVFSQDVPTWVEQWLTDPRFNYKHHPYFIYVYFKIVHSNDTPHYEAKQRFLFWKQELFKILKSHTFFIHFRESLQSSAIIRKHLTKLFSEKKAVVTNFLFPMDLLLLVALFILRLAGIGKDSDNLSINSWKECQDSLGVDIYMKDLKHLYQILPEICTNAKDLVSRTIIEISNKLSSKNILDVIDALNIGAYSNELFPLRLECLKRIFVAEVKYNYTFDYVTWANLPFQVVQDKQLLKENSNFNLFFDDFLNFIIKNEKYSEVKLIILEEYTEIFKHLVDKFIQNLKFVLNNRRIETRELNQYCQFFTLEERCNFLYAYISKSSSESLDSYEKIFTTHLVSKDSSPSTLKMLFLPLKGFFIKNEGIHLISSNRLLSILRFIISIPSYSKQFHNFEIPQDVIGRLPDTAGLLDRRYESDFKSIDNRARNDPLYFYYISAVAENIFKNHRLSKVSSQNFGNIGDIIRDLPPNLRSTSYSRLTNLELEFLRCTINHITSVLSLRTVMIKIPVCVSDLFLNYTTHLKYFDDDLTLGCVPFISAVKQFKRVLSTTIEDAADTAEGLFCPEDFNFYYENIDFWRKMIDIKVFTDEFIDKVEKIQDIQLIYMKLYDEFKILCLVIKFLQLNEVEIPFNIHNADQQKLQIAKLEKYIEKLYPMLEEIGIQKSKVPELAKLIENSIVFRHYVEVQAREVKKGKRDVLNIPSLVKSTHDFYQNLCDIKNVKLSDVVPIHTLLKRVGRNIREEIENLQLFGNVNSDQISKILDSSLKFLSYIQDGTLKTIVHFTEFYETLGRSLQRVNELQRFIKMTSDTSSISLSELEGLTKTLQFIIGDATPEELTYFKIMIKEGVYDLVLFLENPTFRDIANRLTNNYASATHQYEIEAINIARNAHYLLSPLFAINFTSQQSITDLILEVISKLREGSAANNLNVIKSAFELLPKLQFMFSQGDKDSISKIHTYMKAGGFLCSLKNYGARFEIYYYLENIEKEQLALQEELEDLVNQILIILEENIEEDFSNDSRMRNFKEFVEVTRCAKKIHEKILLLEQYGHPDYQGSQVIYLDDKIRGLTLEKYQRILDRYTKKLEVWQQKVTELYDNYPILCNMVNSQLYQLISKVQIICTSVPAQTLEEQLKQIHPIKPFIFSCFPRIYADPQLTTNSIYTTFCNAFYGNDGCFSDCYQNNVKDAVRILELVGRDLQSTYKKFYFDENDEPLSVQVVTAIDKSEFEVYCDLFNRNQSHIHHSQILYITDKTSRDELTHFLKRITQFPNMNYYMVNVNDLNLQVREDLLDWISRLFSEKSLNGWALYLVFYKTLSLHAYSFIESRSELEIPGFDNSFKLHQDIVKAKKLVSQFEAERYCWQTTGKSHAIAKKLQVAGGANNTCTKVFNIYDEFTPLSFMKEYRKMDLSNIQKIVIHFDISFDAPLPIVSQFFELFINWGLIYDQPSGDMEIIDSSLSWVFFIELHAAPENDGLYSSDIVEIQNSLGILKLVSKNIQGDNIPYDLSDADYTVAAFAQSVELLAKVRFDIANENFEFDQTKYFKLVKKLNEMIRHSEDVFSTILQQSDKFISDQVYSLISLAERLTGCKYSYHIHHYRKLFVKLLAPRCKWLLDWLISAHKNLNSDEGIDFSGATPYERFELLLLESIAMSEPPPLHHIQNNIYSLSNNLAFNPPMVVSRLSGEFFSVAILQLSENTKRRGNYDICNFQDLLNTPARLRSDVGLALNVADTSAVRRIIEQQNYVLTPDFAVKLYYLNEMNQIRQNISFNGDTGVGKTEILRLYSVILNCTSRHIPDILFEFRTFLKISRNDVTAGELKKIMLDSCFANPEEGQEDDDPNNLPINFGIRVSAFVQFVKRILAKYKLIVKTPHISRCEQFNQPATNQEIQGEVVVKNMEELKSLVDEFLNIKFKNLFFCLRMHKNMTADEIRSEIQRAINATNDLEYNDLSVVVFIDEFNTTSHMGMIKSIMCDRMLDGKKLPDKLHFVSAMNPHKDNVESRLKLKHWQQGHIGDKEFIVRPIPISLDMISMDFGELSKSQVKLFLDVILQSKRDVITSDLDQHTLNEFIYESQLYFMRNNAKIQRIHPSIRDLKRAIDLYIWFRYESDNVLLCPPPEVSLGIIESHLYYHWQSLIMSIFMCYYLRLPENAESFIDLPANLKPEDVPCRENFVKLIEPLMEKHDCPYFLLNFKSTAKNIMRYLFDNTNKPPGIACTMALMENLFCVVNCIALNMPLIIWGPPGSSKTLSYQIAEENMAQESPSSAPKTQLYQRLPKLYQTFRYQCSEHSTDTELGQRYEAAKSTIRSQQHSTGNKSNYRIVVMLDEAGLIEEQRAALKVIHYHMDHPEVGTVIVSNGPLDAAKMSRALQVNQSLPTPDDLAVLTASCLYSEEIEEEKRVHRFGEPTNWFRDSENTGDRNITATRPLVKKLCACFEMSSSEKNPYTSSIGRNIFHLRDYVYFLRYLRDTCCKPKFNLTPAHLLRGLERNLNGIDRNMFFKMATDWFSVINENLPLEKRFSLQKNYLATSIELIKENLNFTLKNGDNPNIAPYRYMIIVDKTDSESSISLLYSLKVIDEKNTIVCRLSDFENDLSDESKSIIIGKVRQAMKLGKTVLMINSLPIESSFYDVFNRFFVTTHSQEGVQYFANIAIGSQSGLYPVHPNFKVILHVPYSRLRSEILAPLPFLNRFEIYTLSVEDALHEIKKSRSSWERYNVGGVEKDGIEILKDGITHFVDDIHNKVSDSHLLRGLVEEETVASLLLRVVELTIESGSNLPTTPEILRIPSSVQKIETLADDEDEEISLSSSRYIMQRQRSAVQEIDENQNCWKQLIQRLNFFLMQIACPEHMFYVRKLPKAYLEEYFLNQEHFNPWRFLQHLLQYPLTPETKLNKWCFITRSAELGDILSQDEKIKLFIKDYVSEYLPKEKSVNLQFIILESISSSHILNSKIAEFFKTESKNEIKLLICIAAMEDPLIINKINATRNYIDQYVKPSQIACIILHFPPEMNILRNSVYHYHTIYLNNWNYLYTDSLGVAVNEEENAKNSSSGGFVMDVDGRAWIAKAYGLNVERTSLAAGVKVFEEIFFSQVDAYINKFHKPSRDKVNKNEYIFTHGFYQSNRKNDASKYLKDLLYDLPELYRNFLERVCYSWSSDLLYDVIKDHCKNVVGGNLANGLISVISNSLKNLVTIQSKYLVRLLVSDSSLEVISRIRHEKMKNGKLNPKSELLLSMAIEVINCIQLPTVKEMLQRSNNMMEFGMVFGNNPVKTLPFFDHIYNLVNNQLQLSSAVIKKSGKKLTEASLMLEFEKRLNSHVQLVTILKFIGNNLYEHFKQDFFCKILKSDDRQLVEPWTDLLVQLIQSSLHERISSDQSAISSIANLFIGAHYNLSRVSSMKSQLRPLFNLCNPPKAEEIIKLIDKNERDETKKIVSLSVALLWNRFSSLFELENDEAYPLFENWITVFRDFYSYYSYTHNVLALISGVQRNNYLKLLTLFIFLRVLVKDLGVCFLKMCENIDKINLIFCADNTDLEKCCEMLYILCIDFGNELELSSCILEIIRHLILPSEATDSSKSDRQYMRSVNIFLQIVNRTYPKDNIWQHNYEWANQIYSNFPEEQLFSIFNRLFQVSIGNVVAEIRSLCELEIISSIEGFSPENYILPINLLEGIKESPKDIRAALPLEKFYYMFEGQKEQNIPNIESLFKLYLEHRKTIDHNRKINNFKIIPYIQCFIATLKLIKLVGTEISENKLTEERINSWDIKDSQSISILSTIHQIITEPISCFAPVNIKDYMLLNIRSDHLMVFLNEQNESIITRIGLGNQYLVRAKAEGFYQFFPFMLETKSDHGKIYATLLRIIKNPDNRPIPECSNTLKTTITQLIAQSPANQLRIRMILMLIIYYEFFNKLTQSQIILSCFKDIVAALAITKKEEAAYAFFLRLPQNVNEDERKTDPLAYIFSNEARSNPQDLTLSHLLVNCLAITLGCRKEGTHFYTRIFDITKLNGTKCPGSDYNRENYDCGFKVEGVELTNSLNIFNNIKKYRCIFNSLLWGSVALSLLIFYDSAVADCKQVYHFFNYVGDVNYIRGNELQKYRRYVYDRFSTFYGLFENDADIIQRNIHPIHYSTEVLYSFYNFVEQNPANPVIRGIFNDGQQCIEYEGVFLNLFTDIYNNYAAKVELYQQAIRNNEIMNAIMKQQEEKQHIVNPFYLYSTFCEMSIHVADRFFIEFQKVIDQLELVQYVPILTRFYKALYDSFYNRITEEDTILDIFSLCGKYKNELENSEELQTLYQRVIDVSNKIAKVKLALQVDCAANIFVPPNASTPLRALISMTVEKSLLILMIQDTITIQQHLLDFLAKSNLISADNSLNRYSLFYSPVAYTIEVDSLTLKHDKAHSSLLALTAPRSIRSWYEDLVISSITIIPDAKGIKKFENIQINYEKIDRELLSFLNGKPNINTEIAKYDIPFKCRTDEPLENTPIIRLASAPKEELLPQLRQFQRNLGSNIYYLLYLQEKFIGSKSVFAESPFNQVESHTILKDLKPTKNTFEILIENLAKSLADILEWVGTNYYNPFNRSPVLPENEELVKQSRSIKDLYKNIFGNTCKFEVLGKVEIYKLNSFIDLLAETFNKQEWKFSAQQYLMMKEDIPDSIIREWETLVEEYLNVNTYEVMQFRLKVISDLVKNVDSFFTNVMKLSNNKVNNSKMRFDQILKLTPDELLPETMRIIRVFEDIKINQYVKFITRLHKLNGDLLMRVLFIEKISNMNDKIASQNEEKYCEYIPTDLQYISIEVNQDDYIKPPSFNEPMNDDIPITDSMNLTVRDFDPRDISFPMYGENDDYRLIQSANGFNDLIVSGVEKGIRNPGINICWANTIIQCLLHTPKIAELIVSIVPNYNSESNPNCVNFLKSLSSVFGSLLSINNDHIVSSEVISLPRSFVEFITPTGSRMHDQQDATELIYKILDAFENVFSKDNVFSNATQITLVDTLKCKNSDHTQIQTSYEHFLSLSFPQNHQNVSLDDLISSYIGNSNVEYHCDECNSVGALKSSIFEKLPDVLIIQLKRYTAEGYKINTDVAVPYSLPLSLFTSNERYHGRKYHLHAACIHTGSLFGGHYFARAKNSSEEWHSYDDTHISKVTNLHMFEDAYILFYQINAPNGDDDFFHLPSQSDVDIDADDSLPIPSNYDDADVQIENVPQIIQLDSYTKHFIPSDLIPVKYHLHWKKLTADTAVEAVDPQSIQLDQSIKQKKVIFRTKSTTYPPILFPLKKSRFYSSWKKDSQFLKDPQQYLFGTEWGEITDKQVDEFPYEKAVVLLPSEIVDFTIITTSKSLTLKIHTIGTTIRSIRNLLHFNYNLPNPILFLDDVLLGDDIFISQIIEKQISALFCISSQSVSEPSTDLLVKLQIVPTSTPSDLLEGVINNNNDNNNDNNNNDSNINNNQIVELIPPIICSSKIQFGKIFNNFYINNNELREGVLLPAHFSTLKHIHTRADASHFTVKTFISEQESDEGELPLYSIDQFKKFVFKDKSKNYTSGEYLLPMNIKSSSLLELIPPSSNLLDENNTQINNSNDDFILSYFRDHPDLNEISLYLNLSSSSLDIADTSNHIIIDIFDKDGNDSTLPILKQSINGCGNIFEALNKNRIPSISKYKVLFDNYILLDHSSLGLPFSHIFNYTLISHDYLPSPHEFKLKITNNAENNNSENNNDNNNNDNNNDNKTEEEALSLSIFTPPTNADAFSASYIPKTRHTKALFNYFSLCYPSLNLENILLVMKDGNLAFKNELLSLNSNNTPLELTLRSDLQNFKPIILRFNIPLFLEFQCSLFLLSSISTMQFIKSILTLFHFTDSLDVWTLKINGGEVILDDEVLLLDADTLADMPEVHEIPECVLSFEVPTSSSSFIFLEVHYNSKMVVLPVFNLQLNILEILSTKFCNDQFNGAQFDDNFEFRISGDEVIPDLSLEDILSELTIPENERIILEISLPSIE